ncbi:MAG: hypothetical protein M3Y56_02505, partial [Armatimonadota bacterium]|nr:hypothetical protein [Armatimonadota bacterium]
QAAVSHDGWNRIVVPVPAGSHLLKLQFSPPWRLGFLCGFVLCAGAGLLMIVLHRKAQRRLQDDPDRKSPRHSQRELNS